ncbi:MAG: hypothetical protein ABI627_09540 [Polyangiaceae bacterium]
MAGALRILLWAVVLLAPGGILLAPLLAAHELRRRNRAARDALPNDTAPTPVLTATVVAVLAESPSGQLAA